MGASELIGNEGQKPIDISGLVSIVNEVEEAFSQRKTRERKEKQKNQEEFRAVKDKWDQNIKKD